MAKKYVADLDEGEKIRMVLDTLISIDQLCLRNFWPRQARYLTKKTGVSLHVRARKAYLL